MYARAAAPAGGRARRSSSSASRAREEPARRRALGRLEAAPGAGRLHAPRAEAAAARRADRRRRPAGAARVLGADPRARRATGSPCWSAPTTWTRPSAATGIAYIAYGKLLTHGTVDEVIAGSRLVDLDGQRRRACAARRGAARRAGRRSWSRPSATRCTSAAPMPRLLERSDRAPAAPIRRCAGGRTSPRSKTCSSICMRQRGGAAPHERAAAASLARASSRSWSRSSSRCAATG